MVIKLITEHGQQFKSTSSEQIQMRLQQLLRADKLTDMSTSEFIRYATQTKGTF